MCTILELNTRMAQEEKESSKCKASVGREQEQNGGPDSITLHEKRKGPRIGAGNGLDWTGLEWIGLEWSMDSRAGSEDTWRSYLL